MTPGAICLGIVGWPGDLDSTPDMAPTAVPIGFHRLESHCLDVAGFAAFRLKRSELIHGSSHWIDRFMLAHNQGSCR